MSLKATYPLPGGTNYLNPSEFRLNGGFYANDKAIMVKPNWTYTLTIPKTYYDSNASVRLIGFDQFNVIHETTLSKNEFTQSSEANYYSKTFTTHPIVKFLKLQFANSEDYFTTHGFQQFQLEEGSTFSGYSTFEPGSIIDIADEAYDSYQILVSNVDHPLTEDEILQMFSAHDAVWGDITGSVAYMLNLYQRNERTLGDHLVEIMVEDEDGNGTYQQVIIRVVDLAAPIISGPERIIVSYPSIRSLESILLEFAASDNVDGDLSSTISVQTNEYLDAQSLGEYVMIFEVSDTSGNSSTFETVIEVIDQEAPLITAPGMISLGYEFPMDEIEILALASAFDNHDGDLSAEIFLVMNTYTPNAYYVGEYQVVYRVVDSSGNTSDKPLTIQVFDNVGPILYFDTKVIAVYQNQYLTPTQITQLLIKSAVLQDLTYRVRVVEDHYTLHHTTPGNYHMTLEFTDEYARVFTHIFRIMVKEHSGEWIVSPEPITPPTLLAFFKKTWPIFTTFTLFIGVLTSQWFIRRKKVKK